jgi:alpha-beta hydrolase superfamily lysophospholipase
VTRKIWKKHLCSVLLGLLLPAAASAEPIRTEDSDIGRQLNLPVCSWKDASVPTKGIMVAVHGLTFYASAYDDFAKHLASQGYMFYAGDMRGFGRWKADYKKFNGDANIHFSQSKEDYLKIIDALRRKHPGVPIYAMGESLGANLAFWAASNHPDLIDGVIVTSPCYKRWIHPRPRWVEDFVTNIWNPAKQMNLEPYINPYLSEDKKLTAECLKDQLICRKMSAVELMKTSITNKETLKYVDHIPEDMPILIIAGEKDAVFKTSTIPEFVSHIGSQHTTLNVLKGRGHLLMEHQPVNQQVAGIVDNWLKDSRSEKPEIGQIGDEKSQIGQVADKKWQLNQNDDDDDDDAKQQLGQNGDEKPEIVQIPQK